MPNNYPEQSAPPPASMPAGSEPQQKLFNQTDSGNAELLAQRYKGYLLFDHSAKQWFIWDGNRWEQDRTQRVIQMAKRAFRSRLSFAQNVDNPDAERKWTRRSEDRSRLEAGLRIAASESALADNGKNWDSNPMLLGVRNGAIELRNGTLRKGRPEDRITLLSGVTFDRQSACPRWLRFLGQIFRGDSALIDFIQRAIGYCMTGRTDEQVIFLLCGKGANGKSTFVDVLRYVLGEYAYNLPFSAFEARGHSDNTNDIAGLRGKRFVTALETSDSSQLNEARLKMLSGQDEVTARFLYGEFFSFKPDAKIWLVFNHSPRVSDDSDGFWRRVLTINFNQQFSGKDCNPRLAEELKAEASGILNWAIDGCLKWQKTGLMIPESVRSATQEYRNECDPIKDFLEECCEFEANATVPSAELSDAYAMWCQARHVRPLGNSTFGRKLKSHGFSRTQVGKLRTRCWSGLRLRTEGQAPALSKANTVNGESPFLPV